MINHQQPDIEAGHGESHGPEHGAYFRPQMLTPEELECLKQARKEADIVIRNYFEGLSAGGNPDLNT